MLIKDYKEIDKFFMERPWGFDDREKMHNLSMDVLDLYVECLSKHLNLSFKDFFTVS